MAEAEERFGKLGPMLGAIGEQAAAELGGNPNGIYIYAEVGDRWYSVYLFRDEGDVVRCYKTSSELGLLVWEEWKAEAIDKRWSVMEYEILGGQFDAHFQFPDEIDVEDVEVDRREIALKRRYGEKPIVYPPWDEWTGQENKLLS
jgi:hypothetical protein